MPFPIRRRKFPVRIRRRKFALCGASLTRVEPQEDAGEEGMLCEYPSPPPWHFPLLSDDECTAEDDLEEEIAPGALASADGVKKILSYLSMRRDLAGLAMARSGYPPLDEIRYTLGGSSFACFRDADEEFDDPEGFGSYFDYAPEYMTEKEQGPGAFHMDEAISDEEYMGFLDVLPMATPYVDDLLRLGTEQRIELYERHARYRIKACKLLQGKFIGDLNDDRLERMYPPEHLKKKEYFKCYEQDGTFGWFFHPDHCQLAALDDYQRLVLINDGGYEYMDWNGYRLTYHTHEIDREYVKYCETISKDIKWIDNYVALCSTCREEWFKLTNIAAAQAMKIATKFTKISVGLAHLAFMEYTSNLCHDFYNHKELDGVYFEIWKRVRRQQKSFRVALKEVYELNMFPLRQRLMEYYGLHHDCSEFETQFCSCTAGIDGKVHDYKARWLIAKRVRTLFKNAKGYEEYARKKLKIAELIGLIPKVPSQSVAEPPVWRAMAAAIPAADEPTPGEPPSSQSVTEPPVWRAMTAAITAADEPTPGEPPS